MTHLSEDFITICDTLFNRKYISAVYTENFTINVEMSSGAEHEFWCDTEKEAQSCIDSLVGV